MGITVTNNHVGEVLDALRSQRKLILEQWGMIAEAYAVDYCPVDTGRLRGSITYDTDDTTMYVGTNVEYAPYVELGTVNMDAQPFLRPALENHMDEYREIMNSVLAQ